MSTFNNKNVGLKQRLLTWDATVISRAEKLFLKIAPGTVNNLIPSNWQSELDVSGDGTKYIVLNVSATSNQNRVVVTGIKLGVDATAPTTQQAQLGSPPSELKILLGVFYDGGFRSIYTRPIFIYPAVFYTVQKSNPSAFALPYDKYFIWEIVS